MHKVQKQANLPFIHWHKTILTTSTGVGVHNLCGVGFGLFCKYSYSCIHDKDLHGKTPQQSCSYLHGKHRVCNNLSRLLMMMKQKQWESHSSCCQSCETAVAKSKVHITRSFQPLLHRNPLTRLLKSVDSFSVSVYFLEAL